MSHSPGPWHVEHNAIAWITDANYQSVCRIEYACPNIKADAALIVAAPDLAESLKEMLYNFGSTNAISDRARAALAKAGLAVSDTGEKHGE
jgi:hypothetical protein